MASSSSSSSCLDLDGCKTTGELSALLFAGKASLPDNYVTAIAGEPGESGLALPSFDMQQLLASPNLDDLRRACQSWGFFQLVNHGVPLHLMDKVVAGGHNLFAEPTWQKERSSMGKHKGFEGHYSIKSAHPPWLESFTFDALPLSEADSMVKMIWPEGNQPFCQSIEECIDKISNLNIKIMGLLGRSLGLGFNYYAQHFERQSCTFRFSFYPACPEPSKVMGLWPHTDPNALTILYQDQVGGLQIRGPDGNWVSPKPEPGAFIIIIGNAFQLWTNNIYRSVEHRVLVNMYEPRLSFTMFFSPPGDALIAPHENLIDDEHPIKFRPFPWSEYLEFRKNVAREGDHNNFKILAGLESTSN